MKILCTLLLLSFAFGTAQAATPDPFRSGLDQLHIAIEKLGQPAASEVSSAIRELDDIRLDLEKQAAVLNNHYANIDSEQVKLDRANRDREDKLRQIDFEQKTHAADMEDLTRRIAALRADKAQHEAAKLAATSDAEIRRINDWAMEGNRRKGLLEKELAELDQRRKDRDQRRADIASDIISHAQNANWLGRRRSLVDQQSSQLLAAMSAALSRALALSQIQSMPARVAEYESPEAIAKKVSKEFFYGVAKEASINYLSKNAQQEVLERLGKRHVLKILSAVGLQGVPGRTIYSVAEVSLEATIAGTEQRTREVTRNLFLIGDYGEIMKRMIQAQGAGATETPEYLAMQNEMKRLADEMPDSNGEVMLQGLNSAAAITTALIGAAGNYVGSKAQKKVFKLTDRWLTSKYKTDSASTVRFFRGAFKAVSNTTGSDGTKRSAALIQSAIQEAREKKVTH